MTSAARGDANQEKAKKEGLKPLFETSLHDRIHMKAAYHLVGTSLPDKFMQDLIVRGKYNLFPERIKNHERGKIVH